MTVFTAVDKFVFLNNVNKVGKSVILCQYKSQLDNLPINDWFSR